MCYTAQLGKQPVYDSTPSILFSAFVLARYMIRFCLFFSALRGYVIAEVIYFRFIREFGNTYMKTSTHLTHHRWLVYYATWDCGKREATTIIMRPIVEGRACIPSESLIAITVCRCDWKVVYRLKHLWVKTAGRKHAQVSVRQSVCWQSAHAFHVHTQGYKYFHTGDGHHKTPFNHGYGCMFHL